MLCWPGSRGCLGGSGGRRPARPVPRGCGHRPCRRWPSGALGRCRARSEGPGRSGGWSGLEHQRGHRLLPVRQPVGGDQQRGRSAGRGGSMMTDTRSWGSPSRRAPCRMSHWPPRSRTRISDPQQPAPSTKETRSSASKPAGRSISLPAQAALGLAAGGLAEQPDLVGAGGQLGELVDVVGQVLVGGQQREAAGQVQGQVAGDQHRGRVDGVPAGTVEPHRSAQRGVGGPAPGGGVQPVLTQPHELPLDPVDRRLDVPQPGKRSPWQGSTSSASRTPSWPNAGAAPTTSGCCSSSGSRQRWRRSAAWFGPVVACGMTARMSS